MKTLTRVAIVFLPLAFQFGGASGQTLTNLYSFSGSDGSSPRAGLVQGSDGNFYGTTSEGGNTNLNNGSGYGTIFRISPSGTLTNLYSFSGDDGYQPYAGLVQGSDGNFYGTTTLGGNTNFNYGTGYGTVFRLTPSGSYTNLYSFSGSDGAEPYAGLVQGSDGNFYGTTRDGGTSTNCPFGCGTVFRITPSGSFSNLYSFNGSDGANPYAALVQGSDGNFYGTTDQGGVNNFGTVFRISPSGNLTNLHLFTGGNDGYMPYAGLVQGSDGNFYGTTELGGGYGNVFRISPSGSITGLYSLSYNDGAYPDAGLVQGSDGNFYGTTEYGAVGGYGNVFRISPSGSFTNFHIGNSFNRLVQGSDGNFYSTTPSGGASGDGTVFRLSIPLSLPANQISSIQSVGTDVILTIPSVAGETYQLQYRDSMSSGDWSNVFGASVTNSIGALLTLTNFGGASVPQGFYRFSITP